MGWPPELVLPAEQILHPLPVPPLRATDTVPTPTRRHARRSCQLRPEASVLFLRHWGCRRADQGGVGGHTIGKALPVHPPGTARLPASLRNPVWSYQGRGAHHVYL